MKRDWDLIRKQLTAVEEENDLFSDIPPKPKWQDQDWETYEKQSKEYQTIKGRICEHLELLIDAGYVEGVQIIRSVDGQFSYGIHSPRLTMAGHDLLDTMKSTTIWEKIKTTAKTKGIELTFDAIKALGALALKSAFE
ncbi:MAG: YjcQ family protein [Pseudomonadota bacterium]